MSHLFISTLAQIPSPPPITSSLTLAHALTQHIHHASRTVRPPSFILQQSQPQCAEVNHSPLWSQTSRGWKSRFTGPQEYVPGLQAAEAVVMRRSAEARTAAKCILMDGWMDGWMGLGMYGFFLGISLAGCRRSWNMAMGHGETGGDTRLYITTLLLKPSITRRSSSPV